MTAKRALSFSLCSLLFLVVVTLQAEVRQPKADTAASVSFPEGVASGDVTPFSAVLWSRIQTRDSLTSVRDESVTVEVALTDDFRRPHFRRTMTARAINDFTVKVVALPLLPNQRYYYRWQHRSGSSPIGTFSTAPARDVSAEARFTWTGDSDGTRVDGSPVWNNFEVFDRIQAEQANFFIYLGDTVYPDSSKRPAQAETLEQFRDAYKEARGYPSLQALLQSVSTYATWDDHEVRDDWAGQAVDPQLYAIGRQAFAEFMPTLDVDFPIAGCAGAPRFRVFRWGNDVELFVLDTHTCRSVDARAACTYPAPLPPGTVDFAPTLPGFIRDANSAFFPPLSLIPNCLATINDPSRTMLGELQKQLLMDALRTSNARFKFIVSPSTVGQTYVNPYSRWEGYAAERAEIIRFIGAHKLQNVVFLSTDDHRNLVHDVFVDRLTDPAPVGTEFVTGPVAYLTDQQILLGFFGLAPATDCSLPVNSTLTGCRALAADQAILTFVGVRCRHLNEYSYGVVDVKAGVATVTLKNDLGQVIHDQLDPAKACTCQVGACR